MGALTLIRRVTVENFKRFEKLEVDLKPLDCLVGPNNSGKTTLLQALALWDFCVHHCISGSNGMLTIKPRTISPDEFYVLPVAEPVDLWTDRKPRRGREYEPIKITASFDGGEVVKASVLLNFNRFAISIEEQGVQDLSRLRSFSIAYLPVFSSFLPREERRTPAVIADELARGRVHGVIRNLLLDLEAQGRRADLAEVLERLFPRLANMAIAFDEANDRYISVTYKELDRPREFDIFSAGSGFQQFVYLFGFVLLRQPTVILLDEPDVHLHGSLQGALLEELKRLVGLGKQVLFATHSRDLIARMSPDQILALEDGSARPLSIAFDVYDTLDRLGSVDPTQLSLIQAYRRVVVVEDRADRSLLAAFCAKVLGPESWQQMERRIAFCYSRGNPLRKGMTLLREQLQQMIAVDGAPLELFVIADRDYEPDRDSLLSSVQRDHIEWHAWERAEIENYLLCPSALLRIVGPGKSQKTLEEADLLAEFERLLEGSKNSANDRLVKAFLEHYKRAEQEEARDVSTLSREAREYLERHWEASRLALADAKDQVLPGLKRWLQARGYGQFSDQRLADSISKAELPVEIHEVAARLARFAGVSLASDG